MMKLSFNRVVQIISIVLGVMVSAEAYASTADGKTDTGNGPEAVSSQQKTFNVRGRVVDDTGEGLPGATVVVVGSTRGVLTDIDGYFTIDVSVSDVLEAFFLGYDKVQITVKDGKDLLFKLPSKASSLDEVTVVAYGKQKRESIISAISTIKTDDLRMTTGQLSSGLAGKLAGIVVMQRTGEPGAGADFWIRGVNTFGANNRPLVLVDGIEREMDLVDVDDIASFSILKDATATAVYGMRGANGIVIITTKRGEEQAPNINIKAEFGMTRPVKIPKMANTEQWLDYFEELYRDVDAESPITPEERAMYLNGTDPDLYPSVDWTKTVYKDFANTGRVNISATGGGKTVRYYIGGSYYTEGGIFNMASNDRYDAQMNYDKFNFRSNVDINITKSTELGLSLSTQYTSRNSPGGGTSSLANLYNYTLYVTPIATPTIYSDGTYALPKDGGSYNPYNLLNNVGYTRSNRIIAQSMMSLTQDFSDFVTKGLKANVKFSWDADNQTNLYRYINPTAYAATGRDEDGNLVFEKANEGNNYMGLNRTNSGWTTINLEASINYERLFGEDHNVTGMLLYSLRSKTNNVPGSYIYAYPYKNLGLAGRFSYSFRSKYFAEFNFGYNGSENFAPKHRFGFFPAYALGYMISNEAFWAPIKDVVNTLKIRGSYGTIGNDQIGGARRFAYNTTVNTSAPGFVFGTTAGTAIAGGIPSNGITTGDIGNPFVSWEEATKSDVGIELGLFNAIRIQADYFYEKRTGIFIQRESTPSVVGINKAQYVNLGRMMNRGVDLSLEADHTFASGFYLSGRANFTFNRNKKLYDDRPDQIYKYQNYAGYAFNQQFGLVAEGLFESEEDIATWPKQTFGNVRPGDIKYRDINGDGVVNSYDKVPIGYTTVPEINYGFGISAAWKGFDMSVFFAGVDHVTRIISGQCIFGASSSILRMGQIYSDIADNRWTLSNQNPSAPYPRLSLSKVENNQQASTFWQKDMSFIRLKNAEIGYTIPKSVTKKMGISSTRIYLQGVNLFTCSKFKLWDPEVESNFGNVYPTVSTVTLGLNINFK